MGLICPPGWIRVYWSVKIIKGGNRLSPPVSLAPTSLHLRPPHTASVFVFISVGGTIRLYLVLLWATCRHHHKGRGHYQKSIILGMNSRFRKKQHRYVIVNNTFVFGYLVMNYTVPYTIDCGCSKMLNHGLFLSLFKLIPCPTHWIICGLAYLNFIHCKCLQTNDRQTNV